MQQGLLKELSEFGAVSGAEAPLSERLEVLFSKLGFETRRDNLGNVMAHIKGGENAKKVLVYTHMDEPGLVVRNVDDAGFLQFDLVGGIDIKELGAQEVYVYGRKKLPGVIGLRPPHILSDEERKADVTMKELVVDIGYHAEKARALVKRGDTVSFKRDFTRHLCSEVCGKALSDRAGIAAIYEIARNLQLQNLDITLAFGTRSYNGHSGVRAVAHAVRPDAAFVLEGCEAWSREKPVLTQKCGRGPAIYMGPNSHSKLTRSLIDFAKFHSFDYQVKAATGLNNSDVWSLQTAEGGIPLAVLFLPVKYMHSSVEELNEDDVEKTAGLLNGYLSWLDEADWEALLCC